MGFVVQENVRFGRGQRYSAPRSCLLVSLAGLFFLASVPVLGGEARAQTPFCEVRGQFFIENTTDRQYVNGTSNSIKLRDRFLPRYDNCSTFTVSSAHLNRDYLGTFDLNHYVEIGWLWVQQSDGFNYRKIFTGYEAGAQVGDYDYYDFPPTALVGTFDDWRVVLGGVDRYTGAGIWELKVDFYDLAGFRQYGSESVNFTKGAAHGETESTGAGTGMRDEQVDLRHKNDSGNWVGWNGQRCNPDFKPGGYKYVRGSNVSYDILERTPDGC